MRGFFLHSPYARTAEEAKRDPERFERVLETYAPTKEALEDTQKIHWGCLLTQHGRRVPWFRVPPPVDD